MNENENLERSWRRTVWVHTTDVQATDHVAKHTLGLALTGFIGACICLLALGGTWCLLFHSSGSFFDLSSFDPIAVLLVASLFCMVVVMFLLIFCCISIIALVTLICAQIAKEPLEKRYVIWTFVFALPVVMPFLLGIILALVGAVLG